VVGILQIVVRKPKYGEKPHWFKIRPPTTEKFSNIKRILQNYQLNTVCAESHCPNMSECWSGGTATFMVMGDTCTRGCRFCNIKTGLKGQPLDPDEPNKLVKALEEMQIFDYIVLTSVDRDDLEDQGSNHFAACVKAIKKHNPEMLVEVLIPDFQGNTKHVQTIIDAGPDVIAHNIETVKRLQSSVRDPRANYEQSLHVLSYIKQHSSIVAKTSIIVGLGETEEEVFSTMQDLREIGVQILTLGQYLRPSKKHLKVKKYVHPDTFKKYEQKGKALGFSFVASGPFVRSSYRAGELFVKHMLKK